MQDLPQELRKEILLFVPPQWLALCSKQKYADNLSRDPHAYECVQWFRLRERRQRIKCSIAGVQIKRQMLLKRHTFFKNFRDKDAFDDLMHQLNDEWMLLRYELDLVFSKQVRQGKKTGISDRLLEIWYQQLKGTHTTE